MLSLIDLSDKACMKLIDLRIYFKHHQRCSISCQLRSIQGLFFAGGNKSGSPTHFTRWSGTWLQGDNVVFARGVDKLVVFESLIFAHFRTLLNKEIHFVCSIHILIKNQVPLCLSEFVFVLYSENHLATEQYVCLPISPNIGFAIPFPPWHQLDICLKKEIFLIM